MYTHTPIFEHLSIIPNLLFFGPTLIFLIWTCTRAQKDSEHWVLSIPIPNHLDTHNEATPTQHPKAWIGSYPSVSELENSPDRSTGLLWNATASGVIVC